MSKNPKYIFVSGGVISGLGKGITTASLALILQSKGYKVSPIKIDMYLNIDAGTIRPQEHGEVFVTEDGIETDQDLGHYERFLNVNLTRDNYITAGQIFQEVLRRERAFEYEGEDVETIPHVTDEIIRRIKEVGQHQRADIVILELGGTVGEYQNVLFFEASRIMKFKDPGGVLQIHVAYLPSPPTLGEMKSKPVQQSVRALNSLGIQPDFVVGRGERLIDTKRKEKIALFCNLKIEEVISNPDLDSIYKVPSLFEKQKFSQKVLRKLGLSDRLGDLDSWKKLVERIDNAHHQVNIGIVGKYFTTGEFILEDSYVSVIEAIKHACWLQSLKPRIQWFDSEEIERRGTEALKMMDGLIVPQGWGSRGVEGKIKTIQFARENKIPYLGLCFGMQMAVIEFARNVLGLKGANSTEVNPKTPYPVIHIMPDQKEYLKKRQYGGTIRLGAWKCRVKDNTLLAMAYAKAGIIAERHRHRYEFNNRYRRQFEKAGLRISGVSPDGKLVEAIELPQKIHPFFVGTQFHPEYKSRPLSPHPIFVEFVKVCSNSRK